MKKLEAAQAVSGSLSNIQLPSIYSNDQDRLKDEYNHILTRSYEDHLWFMITLKPLNMQYKMSLLWYKERALKYVRGKLQKWHPSVIFLARHIMAPKDHYHILICVAGTTTLPVEDQKIWNHKYKVDVRLVATQGDRLQVFSYIYKEGVHRVLQKGLDYLIYLNHI